MEDLIKKYIINLKDKSKNTRDAYSRDLYQFNKYFKSKGIKNMDEIEKEDIHMYVIYLEDIYNSKNTINRKIAVISNFLKSTDFVKNLEIDKYRKKQIVNEVKLLTKEEFNKIISCMDISNNIDYRNMLIILFMYYNGLKTSQILNIKINNIDFDMGILKLNDRYISLNQDILLMIKEYISKVRNEMVTHQEYLFLSTHKYKLTRQAIWKAIKKYIDKSGIKKEVTIKSLNESYKFHKLMV